MARAPRLIRWARSIYVPITDADRPLCELCSLADRTARRRAVFFNVQSRRHLCAICAVAQVLECRLVPNYAREAFKKWNAKERSLTDRRSKRT